MNPKYDTMELVVNKADSKLELPIPKDEGHAFVRYRIHDGQIDLQYIEVSTNLRGQGIASTLATKVFEYVAAEKLSYTILCPFLKTWKNRKDLEAEQNEAN